MGSVYFQPVWDLTTLEQCDRLEKELTVAHQKDTVDLELAILKVKAYFDVYKSNPVPDMLRELQGAIDQVREIVSPQPGSARPSIRNYFYKMEELAQKRELILNQHEEE